MTTAAAAAALALALPAPAEPLPVTAPSLARAYVQTTAALDEALAGWVAAGGTGRARTPRDVTLLALYQQRIVRLLGRRPRLAGGVLVRVPGARGRALGDLVAARRALNRLNPPVSPRLRLRIGPAAPAANLLRWYREAERRFGVPWPVLAAVNLVESAFGRVRSASSAGAQGPMQFLPATWRAYGLGGDVHDPHDAILGAANYLEASGARRDLRGALFAYNRSQLYVDAVLRYAGVMTRQPLSFYALYAWQVIVRTTAGERRLTGPGR